MSANEQCAKFRSWS